MSERIFYQFTLPDNLGQSQLVPIPPRRRQGELPLVLSQSRLELIAAALAHPDQPVPNPSQVALPQHLSLVAGTAIHLIVQTTEFFGRLRPPNRPGHRKIYRERLNRAAEMTPTTKKPETRRLINLLADDRLAFPKIPNDEEANRAAYQIITAKVEASIKTQPPFTDTPGLFNRQIFPAEIPFPDPRIFNEAWEKADQSARLRQMAENLFDYHAGLAVLPSAYATPPDSPWGYASELRTRTIIPRLNVVWSGRLDAISRGRSPQPPHQRITVIDYKSSPPRFPPPEIERQAARAALWMTAQTVINLPDILAPTGTAVEVKINRLGQVHPDISLGIFYLGLTSPPTKLDFSNYWGHDWNSPGRSRQEAERFADLIGMIRANAELLEPILRPRR